MFCVGISEDVINTIKHFNDILQVQVSIILFLCFLMYSCYSTDTQTCVLCCVHVSACAARSLSSTQNVRYCISTRRLLWQHVHFSLELSVIIESYLMPIYVFRPQVTSVASITHLIHKDEIMSSHVIRHPETTVVIDAFSSHVNKMSGFVSLQGPDSKMEYQ